MGEDPALGRPRRGQGSGDGGHRAGEAQIAARPAIVLACALLLAGAAATAATRPEATPEGAAGAAGPGLLARLPDHRVINFRCEGSGRPTVLLESGYGATSMAWTRVQGLIAARLRSCAYDRAGYGYSDPGPAPRDGAAIAQDLDQALRAAHIDGPFIVVGHSAGGLYARIFADRRPGDVVGMVLVDPSVEYQDRRFAAAFGPGAGSLAALRARGERCLAAAQAGSLPSSEPALAPCAPPPKPGEPAAIATRRLAEATRPSTWKTQLSELDSLMSLTSDEVAAGRQRYGDLPLIVLTADGTSAGAPPGPRPAGSAFWTGLHIELAARSDRGAQRTVSGSSHIMMRDRPDAIATAIKDVAAQIRPGEAPR